MCGRYTLTTVGGRLLAERFELRDPDALEPATLGRYNVCPTEPVAIACADGDGARVYSVCILTCDANSICAPVHDRMPVVLAGPDEEAAWLAGETDGVLGPCAAARTTAAPANPAVNKAGV